MQFHSTETLVKGIISRSRTAAPKATARSARPTVEACGRWR